jgi:hypothetical protein
LGYALQREPMGPRRLPTPDLLGKNQCRRDRKDSVGRSVPKVSWASVRGHEEVPGYGQLMYRWWPDKYPLVATRSTHPSLNHPPEGSPGR